MHVFTDKPKSAHEALDRIIKVLRTYFNHPSDELFLQVAGDNITGYIVSNKFHELTEDRKIILLNNILNNYSDEKRFLGGIMLLSVIEKGYIGDIEL